MMISNIPVVQALIRDAERYDDHVLHLAVSFGISHSLARTCFRAYCRQRPYDWETCYRQIMAGGTDWLDELARQGGTSGLHLTILADLPQYALKFVGDAEKRIWCMTDEMLADIPTVQLQQPIMAFDGTKLRFPMPDGYEVVELNRRVLGDGGHGRYELVCGFRERTKQWVVLKDSFRKV